MNILITGATGAVGFDLLKLLSENNKIYAFYRSRSKKIKKIKSINWIKINSLNNYVLPKKLNIECIIHCAVDQKYLELNKKRYFNSNVKMIQNLINIFKNLKEKRIFINFSSIEVYGNIKKKTLKENYKPLNQNTYGQMKYKCEKILEKSNINYVNLRLPGILCKFSNETKHRPWINNISHKFLNNEDIQIYNPMAKFNNLIDTSELSKIILKIIKLKIDIKDNFNIGSSEPISLMKTIDFIKKITKSKSFILKKKTKRLSFSISTKKIEDFMNHKIGTTQTIIKNHLSYLLNH